MKNREVATVLRVMSEKIEELENDIRWRDIAMDDLRMKLKAAEDESAELRSKIDALIVKHGLNVGRE